MKRRILIPEVVQTSTMDCGPACLKALFGGFNTYLSYGRLREACQTDVDGTSIDTIEEIASQLGMAATQSMVPLDLLLLAETGYLPAIVVTLLPDGATHFVVVWRVLGAWVQIMDPAAGRVWVKRRHFLKSLYLHEQTVPAEAWKEWSSGEQFAAGVRERCRLLEVPADPWPTAAHQDAALRLALHLKESGRLRPGAPAREFLVLCAVEPNQIPDEYWAVRQHCEHADCLILRGAVVVSGAGLQRESLKAALPDSLARARTEQEPSVLATIRSALSSHGRWLPTASSIALLAAALGTVLEALLFRGLFDVWRHLESTILRCGAAAAAVTFLLILLALDWSAMQGLLKIGRQLEMQLRMRFMAKIPKLGDRYFQSRLLSDMASRAHSLQALRRLPEILGRCLQLAANIAITGMAMAWVYPGSLPLICAAIAAACLTPMLYLPVLAERDLRFREYSASLGSLYLDCLLGSRAVQAHGAQETMLAVQARQLFQWRNSALRKQALSVGAGSLQTALTLACIIALIYQQASIVKSPAGLLLLVYWAISIPQSGAALTHSLLELPAMRNLLLRFLEPLGAPDEGSGDVARSGRLAGVKIDIESASIFVAGRAVLSNVTVSIRPGEHVGIVGTSGAGKSTLLGCLLGWYRPAHGEIRVDDRVLDANTLAQLRHETAWIDPQVHLFDRSLFDNLRYGNESTAADAVGDAISQSGLGPVFKHWPAGLQTSLGQAGAKLSGGEGQRVRIGRALCREQVRLAVLDEPTRGLGRGQRKLLLARMRRHFAAATLFCVTHDVSDTLQFDRVLVVEQGRVVENGCPAMLQANPDSRYRRLLDAESAADEGLWNCAGWRRIRIRRGVLRETASRICA